MSAQHSSLIAIIHNGIAQETIGGHPTIEDSQAARRALRDLEEQYEVLKSSERQAWNKAQCEVDYAAALQEQLEAAQEQVRINYPMTPVDALLSDLSGLFVPFDSLDGLLVYGEFLERVAVFKHEVDGSNPATSRRIEVEITGDGSGVALPPLVEGFGPRRTWNPSGGAGASPASSSDAAGAEVSSPASEAVREEKRPCPNCGRADWTFLAGKREGDHGQFIRWTRCNYCEASSPAKSPRQQETSLCSKHGPWIENERGCPGCVADALGIPYPALSEPEAS